MKIQKFHELEKTWHGCPHCDYKAKHKKSLIKHLASAHDICVKQ